MWGQELANPKSGETGQLTGACSYLHIL